MLTNAAVKTGRPRASAYKLTDERGLTLLTAPNGRRSFRWRFRLGGREQLLTFGTWPEISLDQAREHAEFAREQLAGIAGQFVLSINATGFTRETFAAFEIEEVETTWTVSSVTTGRAQKVTELILRNRPR